MPINASRLRRILRRKFGFEEAPSTKHECYVVIVDDEIVARTFMSRGRGTIDDNLLKLMAQELNEIRLRDFKQAISCVIERDDFIKMVSRSSPQ